MVTFHEDDLFPFVLRSLYILWSEARPVDLVGWQGLEEDLEKSEDKLLQASQKLDKASTSADDSGNDSSNLHHRCPADGCKLSKIFAGCLKCF